MNQVKEYLMKLGLTDSQSRVLKALFEEKNATAKELSATSGIPHTKIYDTLATLEAKGLVKYTLGTPKQYQAMPTKTVLDILIQQQEQQLKQIKEAEESILSEVSPVIEEGEPVDIQPQIWIYHGDSIWREYTDQLNSAKKLFTGSASTAVMKSMWEHPGIIDAYYNAIKRGVTVKGIYPSTFGIKEFMKLINKTKLADRPRAMHRFLSLFKSSNFQARQLREDDIHNDFAIVDDKLLGLSLKTVDGTAKTAIKITEKNLINVMQDYFDYLWQKSKPVGMDWHKELKAKVKK